MYQAVLFHDDSKLFVFTYVGLAVVLALWLGLFWLAAVVGVHLLLEIVKQHYYDPRPLPALTRSLWELKLDIGLVLAGLVIGLYMGLIIGAAGLGAAGRVGVQAATRVGIWQRGLRGFLLTMDDVAMVVKARSVKKKKRQPALALAEVGAHGGVGAAFVASDENGTSGDDVSDATAALSGHGAHAPPSRPAVPPAGGPELWGNWVLPRWSRGDRCSIGFTVACVLLILATPLLTGHTVESTWATIAHELHPFPASD